MDTRIISSRTETFPWGAMVWLADASSDPELTTSTARMTVHAGQTSPAHSHSNCTEVISVLAGAVVVVIDGTRNGPLSEHQSVRVPPGTVHFMINERDIEAELVVTYSSGERDYIRA